MSNEIASCLFSNSWLLVMGIYLMVGGYAFYKKLVREEESVEENISYSEGTKKAFLSDIRTSRIVAVGSIVAGIYAIIAFSVKMYYCFI